MSQRVADTELGSLASSDTDSNNGQHNSDGNGSERSLNQGSFSSRRSSLRSLRLSFDNMRHSLGEFNLNQHIMQLSETIGDDYGGIKHLEERKTLGYFSGLALVLSLEIGSGIFSSPGSISSHVRSVGSSLAVWFVAGILAWTGASSYAELGGCLPLNGGSYAYLKYIYSDWMAFLFSWTAITAIKPGSSAIISIIFGEYIARLFMPNVRDIPPEWVSKLFAILCITCVVALNVYSNSAGTAANNIIMVIKVFTILGFVFAGIIVFLTGHSSSTNYQGNIFEGSSTNLGDYAIALYSALWAFDGFDNACYVTAEMKNPEKILAPVIHSAQSSVIVLYLLINISYFAVIPFNSVSVTNTVGLDFGFMLLGRTGVILCTIAIAVSCFGALCASTFSSGRLIYVVGKQGHIPKMFGTLHPKRHTPVNALLMQAIFTYVMIIIGNFNKLVTFYGVVGYTWYFTVVLGLIILRLKEPNLHRPYKTWISTPVLFCCVAVFLVSRSVFASPWEAISALIFIVTGFPIYMLNRYGSSWINGIKKISDMLLTSKNNDTNGLHREEYVELNMS